jgi:hypothetical protein
MPGNSEKQSAYRYQCNPKYSKLKTQWGDFSIWACSKGVKVSYITF